jgi:putative NADH-flavin reductase
MKIAVFGANGGIGIEVVKQALDAGHEVVGVVRNRRKLPVSHPKLTVIEGDARDAETTNRAVVGCDAVVSALGNFIRQPNTALSGATQQIVAAMKRNGVRRFLCVTSLGQGATRAKIKSKLFLLFLTFIADEIWKDKERQEDAVRASGLDWIIVRPGGLTRKPARRAYRVYAENEELPKTLRIARADVADFIVKNVSDRAHIGQAVGLSD